MFQYIGMRFNRTESIFYINISVMKHKYGGGWNTF